MGILQEQIYPALLALDYGRELFATLGEPTRSGQEWLADCPRCGKRKFSYNSQKPVWKCWSCESEGFHGDWVGWLVNECGMAFPEALKMLAQRAGVPLQGGPSQEQWEQRQRRQSVFAVAAEFFKLQLQASAGRDVKEYLLKRGYSEGEIAGMGLGAYTSQADLLKHLERAGYSRKEAEDAGLLTQGFGITHRMTMIWTDAAGQVAGLNLRSLLPAEELDKRGLQKYKYSLGMKKSAGLVGLPSARTYNWAVLVEGGMDALLMNYLGIPTMALGGLIISREQIGAILTTQIRKLYVCLDNEPGGRGEQGTVRTLRALAQQEKVAPYVVDYGDASEKDPEEYIRAHGKEAFEERVRLAVGWPGWLAAYESRCWKRSGDAERDEQLRRIGDFAARCGNTVHREQFLREISRETGIDYVVLSRMAGEKQPAVESVDIERSVLGWLIDNPAHARSIANILQPDDFQMREHARAFEGVVYLLARGMACSRAALVDWARNTGWMDEGGVRTVFERLRSGAADETEAYSHARIVRERSQLRRVGEIGQRLLQVSRDPAAQPAVVIDNAMKYLRGITSGDVQPGEVSTIREIAFSESERLVELYSLPPEERNTGLTTGLSKWLDDTTGGFLPGDMWGWGARTNHGKTKLLAYAMAQASQSYRVGWINLEMGVVRLMKYLWPAVHNVRNPEDRIHAGSMYDPSWWDDTSSHLLQQRVQHLDPDGNFLVVKQAKHKTIANVRAYMREMAERGAKVVALDQLEQVQEFSRNIQRDRSALREVIWSLKDAANQLGIAVVVVNQLSRAAAEAQVNVSHFSEGGGYEGFVDFAVLFTDVQAKFLDHSTKGMVVDKHGIPGYPKADDLKEPGRVLEEVQPVRPVEVRLAKSRDGVTGKRLFRFDYVHGIKEQAS